MNLLLTVIFDVAQMNTGQSKRETDSGRDRKRKEGERETELEKKLIMMVTHQKSFGVPSQQTGQRTAAMMIIHRHGFN